MSEISPVHRMKLFMLASILLLVSVATVSAACPVAADLERGIALTRTEDGFTTVYRKRAGVLSSRYEYTRGTGPADNVTATYVHGLLSKKRSGGSGGVELSYDSAADALDASLKRGRDWQSGVTLLRGSKAVSRGTFTVDFIRKGRLSLGRCSYPVWIVKTSLALPQSDPIRFRYAYAPSLGIPMESIRIDARGKPIHGVQYDSIRLAE
ncbi:hypothetical protein [Martelella radicis]|uniref:DUF3108 domain-containing protein n=1 Tax=Martelella radicis TaxID=1397476 RepID=A0A7W6KJI9_9HYPH|nr:hypothetical protein [Martelella radicis]MBB4121055.1 hypothetical protein [Martelella radicis]